MIKFRRTSTLVAGIASATLTVPLMASPAEALTKERSDIPLTENLLLEGFCDFPVLYSDVHGSGTQTLVFDNEGNLLRIELRYPGLRSQLTNVETGESVTVNNSGPVTVYPQEDGSYYVIQRGQSTSFDQGLITGEPHILHHTGRIETTAVFNPETGFVDFTSQERTGHTTDLCAVLAP
jgi:hypothetical protein